MRFDSVRWRLVLSYVLLTVMAVGLVGALALTIMQQFARTQTRAQLQSNARAIAKQIAPLMQPSPRTTDLQNLAASMSFLGRVRVRILDMQGNMLVDSGFPGQSTSLVWLQPDPQQGNSPVLMLVSPRQARNMGNLPMMSPNQDHRSSMMMRVEESLWGRQMVFDTTSIPESTPVALTPAPEAIKTQPASSAFVISSRALIGSVANPLGYVQLDSENAPGGQILVVMRSALLFAGLGAVLVAAIAGLLVGRSISAPIVALAQSADRMSAGDLSARAPVYGAGEIAHLASQFNHMAERLQASFAALSAERDALRRFIADASHELRTPITALGNFIELMQGPAANDPAAREEFLNESQAQVERMEWITSNLLNLSRLDAGLVQLDRRPQDLGELLQSAAGPLVSRAQGTGVRLEVQPPATGVQVVCDRARIEMAIGNLLENAIKFTPAGGQVILSGWQEGEHTRIQVADTGSGIAPEDLPHIFERFYRGKTTQQGSGLGLAIVQSILQAHGGEVQVESEPGKGSRFTLLL